MNRRLNFVYWFGVVLTGLSCVWMLVEWIRHTGRASAAWDVFGFVAGITSAVAYFRKRPVDSDETTTES